MAEELEYDYTSRHWSTNKTRPANSQEEFPPFIAKTKIDDTVWPLYIPFDATDQTQGVVWLSDSLAKEESAGRGMTAITPKGVKDNTLVATKNDAEQKVSTENIVFNGDIKFGGTVTGITTGITSPKLVVKIANKNVLPTDETNYILGSGSIQNDVVTVPIGMLPLNMIPSLTEDKLPNNISGSKIADGTITSDKILSINGNKIETGTITEDKLTEDAKNALFSQKQITLTLGGDLTSDSIALLFGQSNTISAKVTNIEDTYINDLFK